MRGDEGHAVSYVHWDSEIICKTSTAVSVVKEKISFVFSLPHLFDYSIPLKGLVVLFVPFTYSSEHVIAFPGTICHWVAALGLLGCT